MSIKDKQRAIVMDIERKKSSLKRNNNDILPRKLWHHIA